MNNKLILVGINFVCLILLLQIRFQFFPLINFHLSENVSNNFNELIANISLGIIISTIFYLVVVYYPEKSKRNTTLKIIQPRLNTILNQINISVSYLSNNRINSNKKRLELQDFECIDSLDTRSMNFYYEIFGNHNKWIPFSTGEQTELNHFRQEKELIIRKIDEIFKIPTISILDEDLIANLAKLRDCLFYSAVESYNRWGKRVTVTYFKTAIYDYYLLFHALQKYGTMTALRVKDTAKEIKH